MNSLYRSLALIALLAISFNASSSLAATHVINFGGVQGPSYVPNNLLLAVGDIVVWEGDFTTMPLHFDEVPVGAILPPDVTSGSEFRYNIRKGGTYRFSSSIAGISGMFGAMSEIISVSDDDKDRSYALFPNPVSNELRLKLKDPSMVVKYALLIDMTGIKCDLFSNSVGDGLLEFDLRSLNLPIGIYLFEVVLDGQLVRRKLIIAR